MVPESTIERKKRSPTRLKDIICIILNDFPSTYYFDTNNLPFLFLFLGIDLNGNEFRVFRLRMHPDTSVFAPEVVFESSSHGRIHYDTSSVLRGILEGEH